MLTNFYKKTFLKKIIYFLITDKKTSNNNVFLAIKLNRINYFL